MRGLPVPATPLVGRKKELADLLRLVLGERAGVVTLTGARGIGKTRLALEVALVASASFETVAFAAAASASPDPPAGATSLLVFDDPGPVEPAGIRAWPGPILCTSERALGWPGEIECRVRPLPPAPAVELLRQRLEEHAPALLLEYRLAGRVCEGAGRVPLRIEEVARLIGERARGAPDAPQEELLAGLLP